MKTLASFSNSHEAHMLCAELGGSGIDAVLVDDNTVQTDWLLSNAIGGVKVNVSEDDWARAVEVYKESRGAEEEKAKEQNKTKHGIARYIKIGAAGFLAILAFSIFKRPPNEFSDLGFHLLAAGIPGMAIGMAFCLLDI